MRTFGADVSHWEGDINWLLGVDYLPFVYYKATDGLYAVDSQFLGNKAECDAVGIPNAPYHWWQETQDPIIQADHFVDTVMPGYKQLIVDVEPKVLVPNMLAKLNSLLDRIQTRTGIIASIYTSANYWDSFIRAPYPNHHPLLVAQYAYRSEPVLPNGAVTWTMWQFTDQFWFSGCNATADGNWFNGPLDVTRNWFGNYHPYDLPPQPPTTDFLMKCIVEGLNVRSGPSTSYGIVGHLHQNEEVALKNIAGAAAWMQIKSGVYTDKWAAVQTSQRYMEPKA
jgi:lysozyme